LIEILAGWRVLPEPDMLVPKYLQIQHEEWETILETQLDSQLALLTPEAIYLTHAVDMNQLDPSTLAHTDAIRAVFIDAFEMTRIILGLKKLLFVVQVGVIHARATLTADEFDMCQWMSDYNQDVSGMDLIKLHNGWVRQLHTLLDRSFSFRKRVHYEIRWKSDEEEDHDE
jgi:hypothetical protein